MPFLDENITLVKGRTNWEPVVSVVWSGPGSRWQSRHAVAVRSHLYRRRLLCQCGNAALVDVAGTDPPIADKGVQEPCCVWMQPRGNRGPHDSPTDVWAATAAGWRRRAVAWLSVWLMTSIVWGASTERGVSAGVTAVCAGERPV